MPQPDTNSVANEKSQAGNSSLKIGNKIVSSIFMLLACVSFASLTVVGWTERQVLNAESWVFYTSALPKNPDVSWALADKITTQIFNSVPVEEKISEVLPPRAGFLASPLTDQLRDRTANLVQRTISSDGFQSVWTGANKLAIDRLLTNARGTTPTQSPAVLERFNLNLDGLKPLLQSRVDSRSPIAPGLQEKSQQLLEVSTDLKAARQKVRDAVQTTDFLYKVLPVAFVASFLGVLAFSAYRRRAVMSLALIIIALLLVELIAVKYSRQQLLSQVQNDLYIPAVSHIYDSLLSTFKSLIYYCLGFWLVVYVISLSTGNSSWAVNMRGALRVDHLLNSGLARNFRRFRQLSGQYRYILWALVVFFCLIYLAFIASINTAVLVNTVLVILGAIFLVQILSTPKAWSKEG